MIKKFFIFVLLFLGSFSLIACQDTNVTKPDPEPDDNDEDVIDEKYLNDKIKPILSISAGEQMIYIKPGTDYDLLKGITAFDNLEGNIIDKVIVDTEGFDNQTPGQYNIVYFLQDLAGNAADPIERVVIVVDNIIFEAPPVYNGVIEGEAPKPNTPAFFGGAWYHKVVSSKDKWSGIEGTFTVPHVKIRRYQGAYDSSLDVDPNARNLDNPSIYMGGNATNESDVGLSFSKGLIDIENNTLSTGSIVFRPFWRYIVNNQADTDVGGYDLPNGRRYAVSATGSGGLNMIANWHYADTEHYYLPGDKLRMLIVSVGPNKLQMQIEVIEKSTDPISVAMRKNYGWKDPENFKSPTFVSPGHGLGRDAEYKRVNAIDQVANEGGDAFYSDTEISNAIWHEVYLYRTINGTLYRVPFNQSRSAHLSAKDETRFTVTYDGVDKDLGGEVITIHPGYQNTDN